MTDIVKEHGEAHSLPKTMAHPIGQFSTGKDSVKKPRGDVHRPQTVAVPRVGRPRERQICESQLLDVPKPLKNRMVHRPNLTVRHSDGAMDGVSDVDDLASGRDSAYVFQVVLTEGSSELEKVPSAALRAMGGGRVTQFRFLFAHSMKTALHAPEKRRFFGIWWQVWLGVRAEPDRRNVGTDLCVSGYLLIVASLVADAAWLLFLR